MNPYFHFQENLEHFNKSRPPKSFRSRHTIEIVPFSFFLTSVHEIFFVRVPPNISTTISEIDTVTSIAVGEQKRP